MTASPAITRLANQTLLFDADDTLWENNVYFERAIASFISFLDHAVHTREEVREHLNTCEHKTIAQHGYGLKSFRISLIACFEQLTNTPVTPEKHARIVAFTDSIADHQIELLPGVSETLHDLGQRHKHIMVTKGNLEEQTGKVERSGLHGLFSAIEVLEEKNPPAYRDLLAHHNLDATSTWMIGNSPRSDINPSMAAGLNAIFIPHDFTWVLEHETVDSPPPAATFMELAQFPDLAKYF